MIGEILVIAPGGNAIKQDHEKGTTEKQFRNVDITARQIARIAKSGYRLVITHGNGPQAGIRFVSWSGKTAIITSLDKAADALEGKSGTHIVP